MKNDESDTERGGLWPPTRWLKSRRQTTYVREPALTIRDLWQQYLKKRTLVAMFFILVWTWNFGLIFMPSYVDYNTAADARARIVHSFSVEGLSASERTQATARNKQLANALLLAYMGGVHTDIETGSDTLERRATIVNQVSQAQRTGQPIVLDTTHDSWRNHPMDTVQVFLYVFLVLCSLGLSVRYTFRTLVKAEYLADLPWKRGWPVVFAALMPALVPAIMASAIRLAYAKRLTTDEEANTEETPSYTFQANEAAARQLYFDFRFGNWQRYVTERKEEISKRLSELAAIAKARQQERSQLLAEQRKLEHFDIQADSPDSEKVTSEFEAILRDPRVLGINRADDQLVVYAKARFEYGGDLYDLGDWTIHLSTKGLKAREVRSGTKVAWHAFAHPIYRLEEGVFCFGARTADINGHLERSELSQAILVAVECLNHINPDDRALVPKAFKVANETLA